MQVNITFLFKWFLTPYLLFHIIFHTKLIEMQSKITFSYLSGLGSTTYLFSTRPERWWFYYFFMSIGNFVEEKIHLRNIVHWMDLMKIPCYKVLFTRQISNSSYFSQDRYTVIDNEKSMFFSCASTIIFLVFTVSNKNLQLTVNFSSMYDVAGLYTCAN